MSHKTYFAVAFAVAIVFGCAISAGAQDCPNPTSLPSISLTPPANGAFGGSTNATLTIGFGALPTDCYTWVRLSSSNYQAANPGIQAAFRGAGPHTLSFLTFAVNATTTVTISAFTTASATGAQVGPTQSATMTLQPLPLNSFSIDRNTIQQTETATGRVELGGGTGGLDGLARVNLTANPAAAVTIPAFVDVGNQVTPVSGGFTEYVSTFTVSPRNVTAATDVTITATRAGVTRTDTIRVMPPPDCRVTVELQPLDLPQEIPGTGSDDLISGLITNVGTTPCPQTALAMRMFKSSTATGLFIGLQGPTTLEALAPNQQVKKGFIWTPVAGTGARTFQLLIGAGYPGIAATDASLILSLTAAQVDAAAAN
jgi:hypothetical protein